MRSLSSSRRKLENIKIKSLKSGFIEQRWAGVFYIHPPAQDCIYIYLSSRRKTEDGFFWTTDSPDN